LCKDLLARAWKIKPKSSEVMRIHVLFLKVSVECIAKELRTNGNHMAIVVDEYGRRAWSPLKMC
jgi:Mg2+/Co2+ transporter CorC